jgi:GMP synthase-like glutamine amidotransferase
MRLLYLHNGPRRTSVARLEERFASAGYAVEPFWAYGGEFPASLSGYAACFLSGSPHGAYEDIPWIQREHGLIAEIAERKIPTLGVCFGSQILGSALCGRDQVFRRSTCDVGYAWLETTPAAKSDPVTRDLGEKVYMFVWHNDEVRASHPDMTILAGTADCPNHIWRYRNLPIWGIQGHPEVNAAQARQWFEEVRARLEGDGADVDQLKRDAHDAAEAKTMLSNFIDYPRHNRSG